MTLETFKSIEQFYRDDERRRRSPEADDGVHWLLSGDRESWRVSYVHDTGEVYAVKNAAPRDGGGLVVLLGVFPPDDIAGPRDIYYQGLEAHLEGWACRCGLPGGLLWVRDRMALATRHGGPVPGESTHLLGTRDHLGGETALCGARDGLVHFPRRLREQNRPRVSCRECAGIQNAGPTSARVLPVDRESGVPCRCCGWPTGRRNWSGKEMRETWPGGSVTWVCGDCIDQDHHQLRLDQEEE